jgi:hypothetical protein
MVRRRRGYAAGRRGVRDSTSGGPTRRRRRSRSCREGWTSRQARSGWQRSVHSAWRCKSSLSEARWAECRRWDSCRAIPDDFERSGQCPDSQRTGNDRLTEIFASRRKIRRATFATQTERDSADPGGASSRSDPWQPGLEAMDRGGQGEMGSNEPGPKESLGSQPAASGPLKARCGTLSLRHPLRINRGRLLRFSPRL